MFFIGIDIGKRNHEVALIDEKGIAIGKTLRITNTQSGSAKLLNFFKQNQLTPENTLIGMEATGHYWLAIYSFLDKLEFGVTAFNPIQSDALRDFYIRKTKTDTTDAVLIAQDVFKLEIQIMLEQIQLLEVQIEKIEKEIHELIVKQENYLTTITGIGDITAAVIMGEIGNIDRFERPNQLLAFAGLDASVHQSGDFIGTKNKLSKRGFPYLRRAIWQAAFIATFKDPALSQYYQKLKARGKSHGTAIGVVSRKLVNIIFAVWKQHKPYEIHLPKEASDTLFFKIS